MIEALKSYLDYAVLGTLALMSFVMVWLAVERFLYLRNVALDSFEDEEQLGVALTRHLTTISTIGANAPYIGLLGTVLGILVTFHDIGVSGGDIEAGAILVGLALALKATAAGLLVAIPAIWSYNGLLRRVEVLTAEWRRIARRRGAGTGS